jgi:lysophosphatidic acid acyltransferase/lysophosphatidylinositol acyltransferase
MTAIANYWGEFEFEIFATDEDFNKIGKENCFCVLNHKYDLDWLVGWIICQRFNLLGVKFIRKKN